MDFVFYSDDESKQKNGCFVFGSTGSGKTRSVFLCVKKHLENNFEDGESASKTILIRGSQFAREVVNRTKPGGDGGFDNWFSSLLDAQLLVIDEVDKIKFTERVMSEFFDLIEHRTSNLLAMVLISNADVSTLCAKMSDESGPAIARRIKETLLPIRFTA
jgi:DNA replication protein DnaC